jgi:hypothetical protein
LQNCQHLPWFSIVFSIIFHVTSFSSLAKKKVAYPSPLSGTARLDEFQGLFAVLGRLRPESQVLPEQRQEHLPENGTFLRQFYRLSGLALRQKCAFPWDLLW